MQKQNLKISEALDIKEFRVQSAQNLLGFALIYLPHYFTLPPAEFHRELIDELQDPKNDQLEIIGFRGSAKTVFGSLALPLWASIVHPEQYPFIIPIASTAMQAGINIANIKYELDNNDLLKQDFGKLQVGKKVKKPDFSLESDEEWQAKNLLLSTGARILARSRGQKIRGLRHRQHRPSMAIIDDPEDLDHVKTQENRDKTERWITGEVIPAIEASKGRTIVIGNILHNDSLIARLKEPHRGFKVLEYPLIKNGKCLWPALYPDKQALEKQRQKVGETAWHREYLLQVVNEDEQEIKASDIKYYDEPPKEKGLMGTGVDYAISKKQTADYTAMVSGDMHVKDEGVKIYIQPDPLNKRLDMRETLQYAQARQQAYTQRHIFYAEEVGYQKAANDEMERSGLAVERIRPTQDKSARLKVAAIHIKNGTVLFPKTGCEELINQLLGFGSEKHDDLVDALVHLINGQMEKAQRKQPRVRVI